AVGGSLRSCAVQNSYDNGNGTLRISDFAPITTVKVGIFQALLRESHFRMTKAYFSDILKFARGVRQPRRAFIQGSCAEESPVSTEQGHGQHPSGDERCERFGTSGKVPQKTDRRALRFQVSGFKVSRF